MASEESLFSKSAFVRLASAVLVSVGGIGGILWFIGNLSFLSFQKEMSLQGLVVVPTGYWKDVLITFVNDGILSYGNIFPLLSGLAIIVLTGTHLRYSARLAKRDGLSRHLPRIFGIMGYAAMFLALLLSLDIAHFRIILRNTPIGIAEYSKFFLYGIILPMLAAIALSVSSRSSGQKMSSLLMPRNIIQLTVLCLLFLLVPFIYGSRIFDMRLFEVQFLESEKGVFGPNTSTQGALSTTFYLGDTEDHQIFLQYPPKPVTLCLSDTSTTPKFSLTNVGASKTIRELFQKVDTSTLDTILPGDSSSQIAIPLREYSKWAGK